MAKAPQKKVLSIDQKAFSEWAANKFAFAQAFQIHGGVTGLYDLGPFSASLEDNMLSMWKDHFVVHDDMLPIQCTILTPKRVLDTSGHTAKFADLMVKDVTNGEVARADKLLEDHIDKLIDTTPDMPEEEKSRLRCIFAQADAYTKEQLHNVLTDLGVKSPAGNAITEPVEFNLMFGTSIGPSGNLAGFLRPETAQGIFVNFKRLLEFNNGNMPFAAAQIGSAFRNEISPRNGLLRVREFKMAEIEHFVNPADKSHAKFSEVADFVLTLYPKTNQLGDFKTIQMTAGEAVASKIIDNETLAYFLVRTSLYLASIGIKPEYLRFRQHLDTEMAHYAADCWDAEILTSYGWVECVGHADRACFDLTKHAEACNMDMTASELLKEPILIDIIEPNYGKKGKALLGKALRREAQVVMKHLEKCAAEGNPLLEEYAIAMEKDGKFEAEISFVMGKKGADLCEPHAEDAQTKTYEVTSAMLSFDRKTKRICENKYTPSVIEPSFGIGRILYSVLEHNFMTREADAQRVVLTLPPHVAPFKCALFRLDQRVDKDRSIMSGLTKGLRSNGVSTKIDDSSTAIGRRYARADEIGIPFAITIDHDTVSTGMATLRERDTMKQLNVPMSDIEQLVIDLCKCKTTWEAAVSSGKYALRA